MQELTRVITVQITNITQMRGRAAEAAPRDAELIKEAAIKRLKGIYGADDVTADVKYFIRDMDEIRSCVITIEPCKNIGGEQK